MRIRNTLLAIVAALLLLNLGVMLSPVARAIPVTQYRAITVPVNSSEHPEVVEQILNQQSAQGWTYVGDAGPLIFKK